MGRVPERLGRFSMIDLILGNGEGGVGGGVGRCWMRLPVPKPYMDQLLLL